MGLLNYSEFGKILISMTKRLFLAINLPPEVKGALYGIQDDFKEIFKHSRVTWVDPEIAHITLHFLGDVDEEELPDLIDNLRAGGYPEPFELQLRGTSCFPNAKRPRIIFVETSNHTAAIGIHKRTAKILVENGFDFCDRPWVPHITIGRIKVQSETCPPNGISVPELTFEVRSFELMESELSSDGPIYNAVESFEL